MYFCAHHHEPVGTFIRQQTRTSARKHAATPPVPVRAALQSHLTRQPHDPGPNSPAAAGGSAKAPMNVKLLYSEVHQLHIHDSQAGPRERRHPAPGTAATRPPGTGATRPAKTGATRPAKTGAMRPAKTGGCPAR
jgi:hypothetical protein